MNFKKLGGEAGQRLSLVLAFLPLAAFPAETLHCPLRTGECSSVSSRSWTCIRAWSFRVVCTRSCPRAGRNARVRHGGTAGGGDQPRCARNGDESGGRAWCAALPKKNRVHLPRLPLRDPATPFLCDAWRKRVFLRGVLPHASRGPFLLLQY